MHFTPAQFDMLRRLHTGVYYNDVRKWDQRALGGLFRRGFVYFDVRCDAYLSNKGEQAFQSCKEHKTRTNWNAPLAGGRRPRSLVA